MAEELIVDIVVPDQHVFQGNAEVVRAPGVEGSFEVLKDHAPMIAAFGIGTLVVKTDDAHRFADMFDDRIIFATSGGFLEVLDNKVTVLAETAEPASVIDVDRARNAEERALKRLRQEEVSIDQGRAEEALERARNRVRVSMGKVGSST
jgi:F-type H+-transporting ATPase subunit epsilon